MRKIIYIALASFFIISNYSIAGNTSQPDSVILKQDSIEHFEPQIAKNRVKNNFRIIKGDSLICGKIYKIWTFKGEDFIGELTKMDSSKVTFKNGEYDIIKMKRKRIYSVKNITVDSECYNKFKHKCLLYLDSGKELDNVRPRMIIGDSLIYRDSAYHMLGININKIRKIMFYESLDIIGPNPSYWLILWPLLPVALYEYIKYNDPEFDLSYMDLKWKKTMLGLFLNSKYIRSLY